MQSQKLKTMSGPEDNNNLTSKAESGTLRLDLENSQVDVANNLKACDHILIGLSDENVAISAISTDPFINHKLQKNYISVTEKESLEDHSSSITENAGKDAFSANRSEPRDQNSLQKFVAPETIYNKKTESAKGIKESVGSSESVDEEGMLLESADTQDVDVKQDRVQASEESQDLEDGEVSDDDEDSPLKMPVCRFYIRNGCNWGNNCRFRHPGTSRKGNYVMFENKVLPVVSNPFPPTWTPSMPLAYQFNSNNNIITDRYYSQDQPEIAKRAPLLPTPSFNEILLTQKSYPKLGDLQQSVPNLDNSNPVVWQSRLTITTPGSTTLLCTPPRIRSPSVPPPRHSANHVRLEVRSTDSATLTCKPSAKRHHWPSPSKSSATTCHGPRTPPCSPSKGPSSTIQTAPKRQRLYTYLSSSTASSESSSYTSTTESSEESSYSDSDQQYRSKSSRRIDQKYPSRAPKKSSSRSSTKCSSRRQEVSVTRRTSRHTSKSKSRKHSSKTKKKLSKKTSEKDTPRVQTRASREPFFEGRSYPGRREYLLMKLLQVEEQIAKKKKKMNMM